MADNSPLKYLDEDAIELLSGGGEKLIREIGIDTARSIVFDVLTGKNIRESTEVLTRRRIAELNLATVVMFTRAVAKDRDYMKKLPEIATTILKKKRIPKSEKWVAQWCLGLTDKAFQNVLRDDADALDRYRDRFVDTIEGVINKYERELGKANCSLSISPNCKARIDWLFLAILLGTVGAQTLTIRGSEKSGYGKLFEKLVLGCLLHMLGFKYIPDRTHWPAAKSFILSSRSEKRESDATLLVAAGKGAVFDIGFIGRGNPEISLDKVTRFERQIEFRKKKWDLTTIIIVDRIGKNSRIEPLARQIGGHIVQMSMAYWPQTVARILQEEAGYKSSLSNMKQERIGEYIARQVKKVPLESFVADLTT